MKSDKMPLATENVAGGIFQYRVVRDWFLRKRSDMDQGMSVSDFAGKEWSYCIAKLEFYGGLKYNITIIATGM